MAGALNEVAQRGEVVTAKRLFQEIVDPGIEKLAGAQEGTRGSCLTPCSTGSGLVLKVTKPTRRTRTEAAGGLDSLP